MKLLYLTPGIFDKGGISRYCRHQITALRELLGHNNIIVVSLLGPSNSMSDFEVDFHIDCCGINDKPSMLNKATFVLASLLSVLHKNPSIIWSAHLYYAGFASLIARAIGGISVVQVYGREAWTPRRYRPDVYLGLHLCDHVISDSFFTARYLESHYRPNESVLVNWDCVDIGRFYQSTPAMDTLSRYGIPDPSKSFNILTLGRLIPQTEYKGYVRLLEVFAKLPPPCTLIYGGGGSLIHYLKERAAALGVSDRVVFTGYIYENDLPNIYRSASVFCLIGDRGPNRGEGIPLTPLESAACGIPIIVGNQDGSIEAVEDGMTGFALNPFDLDSIRNHILMLKNDQPLRARMGEAARRRIEREHSYLVFRDRVKHLLNAIIA